MAEMVLFHSPNACSEGISLLLKEIGAPYRIQLTDLKEKAQLSPEFRAVNPKGKVPALQRPDGSVLTEFTAIAFWLAKTFPQAGLIGTSLEDEARALELLDFIVASLHMRGFTLLKMPQKFLSDPACHDQLRAHGRAEVDKGLAHLSALLGAEDFLLGTFGIADAAAYYNLRWAVQEGIALPDNLTRLFERLDARHQEPVHQVNA